MVVRRGEGRIILRLAMLVREDNHEAVVREVAQDKLRQLHERMLVGQCAWTSCNYYKQMVEVNVATQHQQIVP